MKSFAIGDEAGARDAKKDRILRSELYVFGQHVMMLVSAKQMAMGGLDEIVCLAIIELG